MARFDPWLILELNDVFEDISYHEIETEIAMVFGEGIDYFIPIHHEHMGSYVSTSVLMKGYIFVKDCLKVRQDLINLNDHKIFSRALTYSGKYQTIDSEQISVLKKKLKNLLKKKILVGVKVQILDGIFKNLIGEVIGIEDNGKKIMVKIKRISREMIAPIPSTLLREVKED